MFAGVGMVVVVVVVFAMFVSETIDVAASNGVVVIEFVSSSKSREALSHFTQKCKINVGHDTTTVGELRSRFSYQSSASESDLQQR